jgi:hypothetical protein
MSNERVFAISDVHGHFDRLIALLQQEQIIDEKENRIDDNVTVVQLGDLGHFGMTRGDGKPPVPKSPTADKLCYEFVERGIIDVTLFGNHDRAVFDSTHIFGGYVPPPTETAKLMQQLWLDGSYCLAYATDKFLLTHAGLHKQFKHNDVPAEWKTDPQALAEAINDWDRRLGIGGDGYIPPYKEWSQGDKAIVAMVNAIGGVRGGRSPYGGIVWRDASESLYDGFRQVFGHSAKDKVRTYHGAAGPSYCIDIGTAVNGNVAGMWIDGDTVKEVQAHVDVTS